MPNSYKEKAAAELKQLAMAVVGDLKMYPAEAELVHAAATGEDALIGQDSPWVSSTENADVGAKRWGREREVRAELIRWLCVDRNATALTTGIRLFGALISGNLDLSYLSIDCPIVMNRCRLLAPATLDGCRVPKVDLEGSWTGPLDLQYATVRDTVFLDRGFRADGEVRLYGARMGSLECAGGTFLNRNGVAIYAESIKVDGVVLFRSLSRSTPFRAEGAVLLQGAQVGGDLDCTGGQFINPGKTALFLQRVVVKGALILRGGRDTDAETINVVGGFIADGVVDARGASTSVLEDDKAGWPKSGNLKLGGFVYGSIEAGSPIDARSRLDWLSLDTAADTIQAYQQLARVLQDSGDSSGAKQVLEEMEAKFSKRNDSWPWHLIRASIGYGYRPENAVWGLLGLTAIGALLSWRSHRMGNMIVVKKDGDRKAGPHDQEFQPIIFSLDNTFPLVKLGHADKWEPNYRESSSTTGSLLRRLIAGSASGRFMRWFLWLQILLGWLLATLFVAAVSGLVQHGK